MRTRPARIEPNRQDPATSGMADADAQALSRRCSRVLAGQRNRGQAELLGRIDRALGKLASAPKDYGLCEECEEETPRGRLALMPYAILCTACQANREPGRITCRRKLRGGS